MDTSPGLCIQKLTLSGSGGPAPIISLRIFCSRSPSSRFSGLCSPDDRFAGRRAGVLTPSDGSPVVSATPVVPSRVSLCRRGSPGVTGRAARCTRVGPVSSGSIVGTRGQTDALQVLPLGWPGSPDACPSPTRRAEDPPGRAGDGAVSHAHSVSWGQDPGPGWSPACVRGRSLRQLPLVVGLRAPRDGDTVPSCPQSVSPKPSAQGCKNGH